MSPQQTPQPYTPQRPSNSPHVPLQQPRPEPPKPSIRPMRQSRGARNGMRATILAVAGLVLAAFLAMAAYGVVTMVLTRSASASVELPAEATALSVTVSTGSVEIRETDTDVPRVSVDATGTGVREAPEPTVETRGDQVLVEVPSPDRLGGWFGINSGSQSVVLEVPADDVERSFTASSDYGDIDSSVDSPAVNLESSYGDVTVTGAVQEANLRTSYGSIEAEDLALDGSLAAESSNGDVTLEFRDSVAPQGRIEASTDYGDVEVSVPDVGDPDYYRTNLSTDFGDEDDNLQDSMDSQAIEPGEGPVAVDLTSDNGDVSIDYLH